MHLLNPLYLMRNKVSWLVLIKILPLAAFVAPMVLLFLLNPIDPFLKLSAQDSFQLMWKGRTFQLFFVWLIALELMLSWETINLRISKYNRAVVLFCVIGLLLPSLYVLAENFFGFNNLLASWASQSGITFFESMPLAVEYLVFGLFFCFMTLATFGRKGLKIFVLPALFIILVGILYTVDNLFPYGQFTPFQLLVPTTALLASGVLGFIGYSTVSGTENGMPTLQASGSLGTAKFAIAWPCAGVESLLIFTAVTLLFLKRMPVSWKAKLGFFAFGAAITYLINVLRITVIFTIGMQYGTSSDQVQMFHFYYGPLYAMAWIVSYPLILLGSHWLWRRTRTPQLTPLIPV